MTILGIVWESGIQMHRYILSGRVFHAEYVSIPTIKLYSQYSLNSGPLSSAPCGSPMVLVSTALALAISPSQITFSVKPVWSAIWRSLELYGLVDMMTLLASFVGTDIEDFWWIRDAISFVIASTHSPENSSFTFYVRISMLDQINSRVWLIHSRRLLSCIDVCGCASWEYMRILRTHLL